MCYTCMNLETPLLAKGGIVKDGVLMMDGGYDAP